MSPLKTPTRIIRPLLVVLPLIFALCTGNLYAQESKFPVINVRGKSLQANQSPARWIDSMLNTDGLKTPVEALITFATAPGDETKSELARQGIFVKDFVADNSYMSFIKAVAPAVAEQFKITSILPVQAEWKITNAFANQKVRDGRIIVTCYDNIDEDAFSNKLKDIGGSLIQVLIPEQRVFEISLAQDRFKELAGWYGVRSISVVGKTKETNFEAGQLTRASLAHLPAVNGGYNLLGDSITIGVGDNTSGLYHVDVRDRIINYNPQPYTAHGQHVNGVVGATGLMDRRGEGVAPRATLIDHRDDFVWQRTGAMNTAHNMSVTNNSYTGITNNCGYAGTYDAFSQAIDAVSVVYPNVLHVFAAGNDGAMTCSPYPYGYATITGTYQPAKNILTVGQCDKTFTLGVNTSRGPVQDGRIKPEIIAVGTGVISTRNDDIYLTNGGTSQASPMVAGAAGLLQQRYKQMNGGNYPSAALVKALLMNGATDKGNPGPDFAYGFGVLNIDRSLKMLNSNRYYSQSISSGGANQEVSFNVSSGNSKLKIMLYWADPAASLGASDKLVNDLDLEVFAPGAPNTPIRPLILNPGSNGVTANAVQGVDSKNNVEQVVINAPNSGNYKVRVKATSIPSGPQNYVVVYDMVPASLAITYPTVGGMVATHIPMRIYWDDDITIPSRTKLEFSSDDGNSWTLIDGSIDSTVRTYQWQPPTSVNSEKCKIRITRNTGGQQFTTGRFVVNTAPLPVLDAVQCPGYINYRWPAIPNATGYQILRKKGPYLENETVITDTFYSFSGLSQDSTYYVAVQPIINGVRAYRSQALRRKPSTGTCAGSFSNGDLMIEKLESPVSGRQFTSSQLGANTTMRIRIRNLDDTIATSCRIAYKLNNGTWQSQTTAINIPGNSTDVITIPTNLDLSATGNYQLTVAVTNLALTDNVNKNDTIYKTIRHLVNAPVNMNAGYLEDFEGNAAYTVLDDSTGITANERWDFQKSNDTGRLQTFVNSDITISGNRSLSMSNRQFSFKPVSNMLIGTFNAAAYSVANTELRLEFDYKMHGNSNFSDSNKVWVRAADSLAWIPVFNYQRSGTRGIVRNSGSISLSDAVAGAGNNFTSSLQIRFGQQDTTVIALNNYGAGTTFDNIRLYSVQNDVLLDSIVAPKMITCNANNMAVTVRVFNGVMATQNNIEVSYRVDNGTIYTQTIPSLAGKTRINYTFPQLLSGLDYGVHTIKAWIKNTGDTYTRNDTLTETFRNQALITSFPSIENFETGDGNFYTEGTNKSWQYGEPVSAYTNKAASGSKIWKTNLSGSYNSNELSYLYSPCYSIGGLAQPMLSFSMISDIEYCGTQLCDGAWVEYSTNGGVTWTKLGSATQGYSWYTNDTLKMWNREASNFRWHVASIPLPVTNQPLNLRFGISSDDNTEGQGIAIDDIHIYNKTYDIHNGSTSPVTSQYVSGNSYMDFTSAGKIMFQINPQNQNLLGVHMITYIHSAAPYTTSRYFAPRSFVVQSDLQPVDTVIARFYMLDSEANALMTATGCNPCSKPVDIYRAGVAKYDDPTQITENGDLNDNHFGAWTYFGNNQVKWVPYSNGYYAELKLRSFSEIWFGDVVVTTALPVDLLNFTLKKQRKTAQLSWELNNSGNYANVLLESSRDGKMFTPKYSPANVLPNQSYTDESPAAGTNYYRLALTSKDGKRSYSNTLSATFGGDGLLTVFPNPASETIQVNWEDDRQSATLQLYNTVGQNMYSQQVSAGNQWRIPVNNLPDGMYLLIWKQDNLTKQVPLKVMH